MAIAPLHLVFAVWWRKYYICDIPKPSIYIFLTICIFDIYIFLMIHKKYVSILYSVSTCGTAVTQVSRLEWPALLYNVTQLLLR